MTRLAITFCAILFVTSVSCDCGPYERATDCEAVCESDFCPKSAKSVSTACPKPDPCPDQFCKCIFNYRRAENGTCIPTRKCPPFECNGENEEYNPSPPFCSDDCSRATPSGDCPPTIGYILIVVPDTPACRCKKNYWRKNGTCVPYNQC